MFFASTILMVRPAAFGFNEQTAVDNAFQKKAAFIDLQKKVLHEFDRMVAALNDAGIDVIIIDDVPTPAKPDAVFPNNWFCTLPGGTLAVFPMHAPNRRIERRKDIIVRLMHEYKVTELEDWTSHEQHQLFLEGTGSMVFDHINRIVYGCVSERTSAVLLHQFAQRTGYEVVSFGARDANGLAVYHTNVMMCIGNGFCVACTEMIDKADQGVFTESLNKTGKQLVEITMGQVARFAGNMLQLQSKNGDFVLVMSRSAHNALTKEQLNDLNRHSRIVTVDISVIETIGGGSARCMMAEIFLVPLLQ